MDGNKRKKGRRKCAILALTMELSASAWQLIVELVACDATQTHDEDDYGYD